MHIDKIFYNKLLKLTIPATIQSLMLALVAVADALMLGSIEQNAMAAVTLATQIQFIQNMIIGSVVTTSSILGAQYWGKGDRSTLVKMFHISLKIAAVTSVIFFIACEFFPAQLMSIFTNESELIALGSSYLKVAAWSYLLTGISQNYLSLMKVSDHTKETAIVSSATVVINIILNAIFIFGLFGVNGMSVRGAALATTITRVIELVACLALSLKPNYLRPDFLHLFEHSRSLFSDFFKVLWPLLGAYLVWGIGFTSYNAFMGHLGTDAAAANSVCAVVRDLVCCITDGIAIGGGILIGNELGAGKLSLGRKYGDRLVKISFLIGIISTGIMLAAIPPLLGFVHLTASAKQHFYGMMVVMAIYMIGRSVNSIVINGIFSAGGDTLYDMYSLAVCMWLISVPLAFAGTFIFNWAPVVVYACTCLDEVGKIPWTIIHYKKYKWVKDLTR